VTTPLILQIQAAALDSKSSVTDALRKAKVACVKLDLTEFEKWVDGELNGYKDGTPISELPTYRILYGIPVGYNPYHGWQPVTFHSSEQQKNWGNAPIGMAIGAIEASLQTANGRGSFEFPYSPEVEQDLRDAVSHGKRFSVRLAVAHVSGIIDAVRNILLQWTLEMEKQGVVGNELLFSEIDKKKSETLTAQTITNIHIGNVGAFVQQAEGSFVHGQIDSTTNISQATLDFVQQAAAMLPGAALPSLIDEQMRAALDELKQAAEVANPESGRLRKGFETLKRVLAPAGETLLKLAVDAAVTKLLGQLPT
jgi:hypothetical protein